LLQKVALHPAPPVALDAEGMRLQPTVAVSARAVERQTDRLAEDEGAQLLLRGHFQRPHSGIGTGIDCSRHQGPDQPQFGAIVEDHGLAIDDARHCARRAGLQTGARQTGRARLGRCCHRWKGKGEGEDGRFA
jgi:hypothetical protein